MPTRPRFDPSRPLVAARAFTFAGRAYAVGDPFPNPEDGPFADRLRARQYEARAVNMGEAEAEIADPVQMTGPKGGRYEITAPWLERPLTVRGKVNAEKALAEMREEGPPLGFIDGGSDVEVEEIGGGWYEISAPWLEEPVKEQGREAAEARQREIHEAGEPETHHGVTLTESEGGNGYYDLTADWLDEPEKVHGEEAARERAAELRQAGPPADGDAGEGTGEQGGENPGDPSTEADAGEKPETAPEGQPGAEGSQEAADQNASNAETQEAASEAAADQSGPDDAEQGDAADKADQADAGDDADAEAGKSDDPADA
ncbi:hypothetical protein vBEliSR6L_90 [Erythrobacter phage vB_EliS_R6L]|nr:hypothetical protein vBEliSR6L_90 [Erythrobacter phage vB_EliS_R6L]